MERLTNKREADAQRKEYENRISNGYPRGVRGGLYSRSSKNVWC